MNKVFADHVTNTAFFLSISKQQMAMLLVMHRYPWVPTQTVSRFSPEAYDHLIGPMRDPVSACRSLERKGLLEMVAHEATDRNGNPCAAEHVALTRAGQLVVQLLEEAGLSAIEFTKAKFAA